MPWNNLPVTSNTFVLKDEIDEIITACNERIQKLNDNWESASMLPNSCHSDISLNLIENNLPVDGDFIGDSDLITEINEKFFDKINLHSIWSKGSITWSSKAQIYTSAGISWDPNVPITTFFFGAGNNDVKIEQLNNIYSVLNEITHLRVPAPTAEDCDAYTFISGNFDKVS